MWVAWTSRARSDPAAGAGQAIAELDVLDRGPAVELGVEAAEVEEDLAADRAAAGPEGVGRPGVGDEARLLMDVVMEQVAELAHQAGGGRLVVVRAEQGGQPGIGLEPRDAAGRGSRDGRRRRRRGRRSSGAVAILAPVIAGRGRP